MERSGHDLAQSIWRQLADRNQWQLIADEETLLNDVLAQRDRASAPRDNAAFFRSAIQAIYSQRLYEGIHGREERAAYELWLMFVRLALRDGEPEQEASDQAQEALARVFAKLDQLRSPESFLSWAMLVFRTAQRDLRPPRALQPLDAAGEGRVVEPVEPADLVADVESRLVAQEFRDRLRAAVPNDLERLTLLRCVMLGDDPRDIARDLNLPLHRTRVAKSRALQRLRRDDAFMSFMHTLDPSRKEIAPLPGEQVHA